MWLAKQQKRETEEVLPAVGAVTIGGDAPAVELDSERRDLAVYAPGGYRWRPTPGQKVLVLKADEGCASPGPPQGPAWSRERWLWTAPAGRASSWTTRETWP